MDVNEQIDEKVDLQSFAELLMYSVENPSEKAEKIRREAYVARYGLTPVTEVIHDYRMALIIAELHQLIANMFMRQAGALEIPVAQTERAQRDFNGS